MTHALTTTDAVSHASRDIDTITKEAKEALRNMRRHVEQYIENAIRLGAAIKEAKESFGRGKFGAWCESELGLKSSQCSVYRQLYETGEDLEKAREWAQQAGRSNASTRDVKLLLRCVDEWRAETRQEQPTKRKAKSTPKVYAAKSSSAENKQSQTREGSVSLPPQILPIAANLATAILAYRSATGEDVLDSIIDYITTAVRSAPVQTSAMAELSAPTQPEKKDEERDDNTVIGGKAESLSERAKRLREKQAGQDFSSDEKSLSGSNNNSAGEL